MLLKIISPSSVIYHGKVLKIIVPTAAWEIGILPHHIPLTSIITPGIVSFLPEEKHNDAFIQESQFLFNDDMISISVGKWLIYLDGDTVELLIDTASTDVSSDKTILEKMKENLEEEIQQIKIKWDINEIEKAYMSLQKITADLKLHKIKHKI